jgi:hypothetical protein
VLCLILPDWELIGCALFPPSPLSASLSLSEQLDTAMAAEEACTSQTLSEFGPSCVEHASLWVCDSS